MSDKWLGLVLAGGRSSRMGQDKALMRPFGPTGPTMLEHAVNILSALKLPCVVSCRRGQTYAGFECLEDHVASGSPASGIHTGLLRARELNLAGVLALACDLPLMQPEILARIIEKAGPQWATLYQNKDTGWVEMLAGAYRTEFLPALTEGMGRGEKSLYQMLPPDQCALLPYGQDTASMFINCNTIQDAELVRSVANPGNFAG